MASAKTVDPASNAEVYVAYSATGMIVATASSRGECEAAARVHGLGPSSVAALPGRALCRGLVLLGLIVAIGSMAALAADLATMPALVLWRSWWAASLVGVLVGAGMSVFGLQQLTHRSELEAAAA